MSLVSRNRQRGTCKKNIAKCANFLNTFQLSNDENVDFIVLNNKLSTVKEIIEEISQLKCAYFNLPKETYLKDALDVTIDLQAEAQEVEIVRVQYFVRGGSVGHRSLASSKHLFPHLPVDELDSSGGQTGVALHLQMHVWVSGPQRKATRC
ncbi:hypothetical protein TNCV_4097471 [Trichonephila clavipes]|nr:hypothetical protein TNCV_4097471 [Trichonephila clavipes]